MSTEAAFLEPAVCFGSVMHERHVLARNRFTYRLAFLRLPLSRLSSISVPLLAIDRPGIFSFRVADHGPRNGEPLLPWIRSILDRHGLSGCTDGEVVLQAMPRLFGYVFNPVSFWFCHDAQGQLRAMLAEVRNTFGERHNYLLHHADHRPIAPGDELRARKIFHVSPFFDVAGDYRFRVVERAGVHSVAIDYWLDGRRQLSTRLSGRAEPLTGNAMRRWLLRFPFMTFGVMARIHWQALRLWVRRVGFRRKPKPPLEETTR